MQCSSCRSLEGKIYFCPANNVECDYAQSFCPDHNYKLSLTERLQRDTTLCRKCKQKKTLAPISKTIYVKLIAHTEIIAGLPDYDFNTPLLNLLHTHPDLAPTDAPDTIGEITVFFQGKNIKLIFLPEATDIILKETDELLRLFFVSCHEEKNNLMAQVIPLMKANYLDISPELFNPGISEENFLNTVEKSLQKHADFRFGRNVYIIAHHNTLAPVHVEFSFNCALSQTLDLIKPTPIALLHTCFNTQPLALPSLFNMLVAQAYMAGRGPTIFKNHSFEI